MKIINIILITLVTFFMGSVYAQDDNRWALSDDKSITWEVPNNDSHMDHIEMSGFEISAILHYGVEKGRLKQKVHLVFPMLRTIPNDTHASLAHIVQYDSLSKFKINNKEAKEYPSRFIVNGTVQIQSETSEGIMVRHQLFPSTDQPVFIDKIEISHSGDDPAKIDIPKVDYLFKTDEEKGVYGTYLVRVKSTKHGQFSLLPGETISYALVYSGNISTEPEHYISADYELNKRQKLIDETFNNLVFESPDPILNEAFSFAKLRATESIYNTKGGLMHGPGGGRYYAAIWANDQAEYANPFFPFLGNDAGNESAINSFRHFARYMNDEYKPIPSSIIAEGTDFWNGAGDRGDMAMIAYGATRFAMAYGDKETARELWPLIEWCLEYSRRKINDKGIVESDSDELEGRFPAGDANLNTSSLYYDALVSASLLGAELGVDQKQVDEYKKQSEKMYKAIEDYFGAKIDGYKTYRYYNGNEVLRAWICTPLIVDIYERSEGTIDALFSDKLWTPDGLASESGSTTFWDRATLYALRGVFAAGETQRAMDFLKYYSNRRLLGEHVPYPVEAYPEGNQRHLSAESALYCRVITEGLWGIRPTGMQKFSLAPKLPDGWDSMALRRINAFNHNFDIEVSREGKYLRVKLAEGEKIHLDTKIKYGENLKFDFAK
ncbi:MAG: glycosyl hydrolase family 65 protein [Bacteroidota bacterium]